jgi:hypothetical protein
MTDKEQKLYDWLIASDMPIMAEMLKETTDRNPNAIVIEDEKMYMYTKENDLITYSIQGFVE